MKMRLRSVPICLVLIAAIFGCRYSDSPVTKEAQGAEFVATPEEQKSTDKDVAGLSDVIRTKQDSYGPRIKIRVNGDLYVDVTLRDSEEVSREQLGIYLARIAFRDTKKVRIKVDAGDTYKAQLSAKFDLELSVNRGQGAKVQPTVLTMSFDQMRLARSRSNSGAWFLTTEGIELIENALSKKK